MRYRLLMLAALAMIGLGLGILGSLPSQAQDEGDDEPLVILNEENIKKATVMIMQVSDASGVPIINCVGTGTLVSADGLILTNAHHTQDNRDCRSDRIVIALTIRTDEPPIPTYNAEVVEISTGFDLAVLRISSYLDGRVIESESLQLPFVELGDSNFVTLDDTIHVFGYPDIENEVISVQRGTVTGFTAEARIGERAWIRTNANIPGMMSGGGAYNRDGKLIGIPTILPARVAGTVVDCREVYDSDGNGQIDENDTCIPIAGPISAIRPSRLARGLVQAATLGIRRGPQRTVVELPPPNAPPEFDNLFFATGVNETGQPISAVQAIPTGTSSLYLFFDYRNMVDGMIYEMRTTIDGRPNTTYSLPPVTWSGGQQGLWYIGSTVIPSWPPGTYEFTLFVEGRQVASQRIIIGIDTTSLPQFSDLDFGIENPLGELVGANYVVPEGNIIRARFNYRNMRPGLTWGFQWYLDESPLGGEGAQGTLTWDSDETQGVYSDLAITNEAGFASGMYRLELYLDQGEGMEIAALSDFIVAGGAGGANDAQAEIFTNFRFAQDEQANLPQGVVTEDFATNTPTVYIFFDWRQFSPGTPWTWRWLVDGNVLIEENTQWSTAEPTGQNYFLSLVGSPALPDATYTFEIELNGIPMTFNVETDVGRGQLSTDAFASAEGIQMVGDILDAETGQGIPGALFIVLRPEFDNEDFVWDSEQILSMATADRNGAFQIPALIPRGTQELPLEYSVLVSANGYFPVSADGIVVTDLTRSPLEITVELNKD